MTSRMVPRLRFRGFNKKWVEYKLNDLARIVGGGTPSTKIKNYWNGNINWYSPAEIKDQVYVFSSKNKITKLGLRKSSAKILPVGTILFTSRAGIGKTAILKVKGTTNQGFQSIVPKSNVLDSYFIFSRTNKLKRYGLKMGYGSTFIEVSNSSMSKMPINIPSLSEQHQIGTFFAKLDRLISLQRQKIALLKKLKRGYLQKMFPRKGESVPRLRFEGFSGGWKKVKLNNMLTSIIDNRGKTPPKVNKSKHPILEVASLGNYYPDYTKVSKYVSNKIFKSWFRSHLNKDDILFSTVGATGLVSLMDKNINTEIAQNIIGLRFDRSKMDPRFALAMFSNFYNWKKAKRIEMGAVQPSIKVTQLIKVNYLIPNLKEQRQIGRIYDQLSELAINQKNKLNHLKRLKKSYLQKMFC